MEYQSGDHLGEHLSTIIIAVDDCCDAWLLCMLRPSYHAVYRHILTCETLSENNCGTMYRLMSTNCRPRVFCTALIDSVLL